MNLTDSRLAQAGNEKLELAMLSFFEQFRKIYIGDQVQKSSKVTSSLLASFLTSRVWSCMEGKQLITVTISLQISSIGIIQIFFLVCRILRIINELGLFL